MSFRCALSEAHGPSAGIPEANEAHGQPKLYAPRGHYPPLPLPLGGFGGTPKLRQHFCFLNT